MTGPKKVFIILASIFFLVILYFAYDISSRTTFPGSKSYMEESLGGSEKESEEVDSTSMDVKKNSE